jgi:outer membrane receptor protein involved in Fe transport
MLKKITIIFILTFIPLILYGQTGKLVGKATDLQTGEPLVGANIIIEGTNLGAATNANGDYLILNVPPGTYTVKGRYIGYREVNYENIKVSVNLTTELNFELPSEAYQTQTVNIIAPKPLINKNTTNDVSIVRKEDIENIPIRGVNAIVAIQAGVVATGNNMYVRGSRADAVAYYVDGVLVNDPVYGGSSVDLINNAVEEIQFQAGGYSAEFGGANGGIITTQTRTGTDSYNFSFEGITDHIVNTGDKFLGTYSYGYSDYTFTAGGPLIPGNKDVKFFIAANNNFQRSPAGFYRGVDFKGIYDPALAASARATGATNVDTFDVYYPAGIILNAQQNTYQLQGNLSWDLNPFTIRLNGGLNYNRGRQGTQDRNTSGLTTVLGGINVYSGPEAYYDQSRAGVNEAQTINSSLKITHVLSTHSFYEVIFNYYNDFYKFMDPIFKDNITAYGDSIQNALYGTTMKGDGDPQDAYEAYGFQFERGTIPYDVYSKQRTGSLGGHVNFLYQAGLHHELKFGGEYTYYTIRRYAIAPVQLASNLRSVADGSIYRIYARLNNYGYDVYGNETTSGLEAPKHPVFAAAYFQDKIEFPDLVINAGLRLDYINIDGYIFKDPQNITFTSDNQIASSSLEKVDPLVQISPRLGFSFPVTDKTVFHAQYGKFIQQSRLRDVYQGLNLTADNIHGGFAIQNPVGFGLRPERTTSYEIGFKQQLGESFAFDVTGFYKDIKDQVQIRTIYGLANTSTPAYYAWMNGDFATTKGIEIKLDLRRTERISATLDYTYSNAEGTGSNPSSSFRAIWQSPTGVPYFPQQISALDFNQAHRGSLNIDYRFDNDDGPEFLGTKPLQNLGVNFLFSFNSGFNFTRWSGYGNSRVPLEPLNASTTPWDYQIDARIDKTVQLSGINLNIYVWVINLLNTQNIISVYNNTGDAYDNGYLNDPLGQSVIEGFRQYGEDKAQTFTDLYKAINYNANNFGVPRQIRLGIRLNY